MTEDVPVRSLGALNHLREDTPDLHAYITQNHSFMLYTSSDGVLSSTDSRADPCLPSATILSALAHICGHERAYSTTLARLKAALRDKMAGRLRMCHLHSPPPRFQLTDPTGQLTGNPKAKMGWSKKAYAFGVVVRGGHHLRSWPTYANIPFADPSAIPGGQPAIRFLLALWDVGILRFEPATTEERDLARRNPDAVLPGIPPMLRAPFCWGPFGRNDIGLGRLRPKTNPLSLPLRHPKNGPKTPKLVLDSDADDDEISETEAEI
uniref:F-box and WD domain protein n=1 Tax=Ganoderma boninense TaxID=34458 RepID=A0A5K1JWB7_9APHY|nr:F-box and WD domain protein [Ganoderma boninense]